MAAVLFLLILISCFSGSFIIFSAPLIGSKVLRMKKRGLQEAGERGSREHGGRRVGWAGTCCAV
jgi:hypothetical protein